MMQGLHITRNSNVLSEGSETVWRRWVFRRRQDGREGRKEGGGEGGKEGRREGERREGVRKKILLVVIEGWEVMMVRRKR